VEIPALTQAEVQVSVTLSDLKVEAGDWVLEPATLKDGVISAQTLVDAADFRSLVRVINVTHRPFIIRKDNFWVRHITQRYVPVCRKWIC